MLTSNILKGGALLDDARRLVEVWDLNEDPKWNLNRTTEENLVAKPSRARAQAVLQRVLRPRLVEPGPSVIAAMKELLSSPRSFVEAYYFEATRTDELLAALAEGPLFEWWEAGRVGVDVNVQKETQGPLVEEGARFTTVAKFLGRKFETPFEVAVHDPPLRQTDRSLGGPTRRSTPTPLSKWREAGHLYAGVGG